MSINGGQELNDPHVEALVYVVNHDKSVSYQNAKPWEDEYPKFRVKVKDGRVRFEMKGHYLTLQEAQDATKPFISKWEFASALELGPGAFRLVYSHDESTLRQQPPGQSLGSINFNTLVETAFYQYPVPPSEAAMDVHDPDVQTMLHRYTGYRQGHEPLTSMAYFCCEVFTKRLSRGSQDAAEKHKISHKLIKYVNNLASNKGGAQARHAHAVERDLTADEVRKLEKAVVAMIIRAAKVAADPNQHMPEINLGNVLEISP